VKEGGKECFILIGGERGGRKDHNTGRLCDSAAKEGLRRKFDLGLSRRWGKKKKGRGSAQHGTEMTGRGKRKH